MRGDIFIKICLISVLLSTHAKRLNVSCMWDLFGSYLVNGPFFQPSMLDDLSIDVLFSLSWSKCFFFVCLSVCVSFHPFQALNVGYVKLILTRIVHLFRALGQVLGFFTKQHTCYFISALCISRPFEESS